MSTSIVREPPATRSRRRAEEAAARGQGVPAAAEAPAAESPRWYGIPRDALPFLGLMLVGAVLRFWVLGDRAQHHDESMHALFSYDLYVGKGFRHDPILHGTFLFIQNALVYWLFGASDFTSRLAPVLHGLAVIGMPYFLRDRRYLGYAGAVTAAVFLTVSPCFLYYSRFIREDIFAASLHFAAAICLLRHLNEQKPKYLYIMAAVMAFAFNDKENTYMTAAIFAAFALFLSWRWLPAVIIFGGKAVPKNQPALDVLVILCTLVAPLSTAMVLMVEKVTGQKIANPDPLLAAILVFMFAASAFVGLRWRARVWATAALIFWSIFAVMFTTLFTNPVGFWTGIIESLRYWLAQQDVHRGEQPHHYYAVLLSLYEYLPIALAIFGTWLTVRVRRAPFLILVATALLTVGLLGLLKPAIDGIDSRLLKGGIYVLLFAPFLVAAGRFLNAMATAEAQRFGFFCLWWAVTAFGLYTWAAEKMPWLSLHMALPIILLGSLAAGRFFEGVDWRDLWRRNALLVGGGMLVALVILAGLMNYTQASGGFLQLIDRPLEGQRRLLWWLGMGAAFIGTVVWLTYVGRNLTGRTYLQTGALTLLAVAGLFYVRASFMATYQFGDIPREILIYTQSSPDVTAIMREINRLNHRTGQGTNFKVAYDSGVSWPFEWYLRNQKGRVFFGDGLPPKDAGVVLVSFEPYGGSGITRDEAARQALGPDYVGTRYRLRWWFPEKYRQLTWGSLLPFRDSQGNFAWSLWPQVLYEEKNRAELWRFLIYREIEPLDSTDFMLFIRKDLIADLGTGITPVGAGAAPAAAGAAQPAQPPAAAAPEGVTKIQAVKAVGSPGTADGQLTDPKNVAVAPDGSLWVVDSGNHRVVKFSADGQFLLAFGSKGEAPGQFNEPWGIAVGSDGNIYVADTWNHRIQKFSPDGQLLKAWGEVIDTRGLAIGAENGYYGPRAIAFANDGSLLITDAGNKRIVRVDKEGRFLAQYGGNGTEVGKFQEPIGLAVDADGNIYVADSWNRRIQKFGPQMQPLAQWPVAGWRSNLPPHKPYLAVDGQGRVYITDPETSRVQVYSPEGQVLQTLGGIGRDLASLTLPTGIAVDNQGRVWVADAGNGRLLAFPQP